MSIQTRTTALQNELVRLYCHFNNNGALYNPAVQPSVEILDTDGITVLDTLIAQEENTGIWYVDWYVPAQLPLGSYYDKWIFQWDASSSIEQRTMIFTVYQLDSYINFLSNGQANKVSNKMQQLLLDLKNDFIYEATHIPIYSEQGRRVQQNNHQKRTKNYYYFTLDSIKYNAEAGDKYINNGNIFTVFESLYNTYSSSSSSSSMDSSSSSSVDSSSSSSSSSSNSSSSSSSVDILSSSTSEEFLTTTTTTYTHKVVLTCVGTGEPSASGILTKYEGEGDSTIGYVEFDEKVSTFSTVYDFAYQNWNHDPRPVVRVNNSIVEDGWHTDYMGKIYFDTLMAPEDSVSVAYNFSYFSEEEMMSFISFGLKMMNGVPPASEYYSSVDQAPGAWDAGILLYAAITALKRLIFGLNWQEKRIIYGRPEDAQSAAGLFQSLYGSYQETWVEFGKNVKTRKLPGIAMVSVPTHTLPGGRSRFFRYLFKSGS
jgi:hypothetical protein